MASPTESFYLLEDDDGVATTVSSTAHTAGPWSADAQHGGPPTALMTRAILRLASDDRVVARLTVDLLGPIPVSVLQVQASVARPGRTVELVVADLVDVSSRRRVAQASAWLVPRVQGPEEGVPERPPGPEAGREQGMPRGWHPGYLDAIEWRWVDGALGEPGPATVWMRPKVTLLPGAPLTPVERLMVCVDSASGASAVLDVRQWQFMNLELSVHLAREPVGEWIGLRAQTVLGGTAAGLASAEVFDREGFVGRSAQSLLVRPVSQPTD